MNEYLSHFSAAEMWNIPYIEAVLGSSIVKKSAVDITVTNNDKRYSINGRKVRSCETDLPSGAVVSHDGKMVASPELLFLELAGELGIHRIILLGLQLCSHPLGSPSKAITTKQKLNTFLAKTAGHRGHRKALRAMRFVKNGSASIMESLAYMVLSLPHSLGGYGLCDAVFNYEIQLKNEARKRLGHNRCFADLYFKKAKLAVEYESFAYHSSPSEQGKDIVRSAALKKQGIEVRSLCTIQLYDRDICKDFAHDLAAYLGKRMQIRSKRFDEMHLLLRELLPQRSPAPSGDENK